MRLRKSLLILASIFLLAGAASAESIDILGIQVPLIEGAELIKRDSGSSKDAKVATYFADDAVSGVTEFYRMYFIKNDFLLIGGERDDDFNLSVKKGSVMFSMKVYRQNERTLIQFIW